MCETLKSEAMTVFIHTFCDPLTARIKLLWVSEMGRLSFIFHSILHIYGRKKLSAIVMLDYKTDEQ